MKALDILMNDRKKIVEEIINRIEKKGLEWNKGWTPEMLLPKNPASNVTYKGRNVLKTFHASLVNEYKDPRWVTFKQAQDEGWKIKPKAKSIILEKWIFEKEEKQKNKETGKEEKVKIKLDPPIPNYFRVFNASDVEGIPPLNLKPLEKNETLKIAEEFIKSSKVPIVETAQPEAFYTSTREKIVIPLKETFKNQEHYLATVLHEMVHSTGKELGRDMGNHFGSEKYAKEELIAELGAMMLQGKLGIKLDDSHIDNHGAYLKSWVSVLKNDFNELFKASIEAEKASELLYNRYLELNKSKEKEHIPTSWEEKLQNMSPTLSNENKISNSWEEHISKHSLSLEK
ncbi:Antirestriction protein ArdC [Cetobacterium ceti]|uniref:Antirestriction protein ArdC n=1 Tax=Cetobacterium ceti TaxID=180163 RepID=A0A1T4R4E5_9FUSO|nr:zincin-like metallopeptidase domain-containing protein [Cetobacterium ceti]SKA10944.1 Antirestriction protein ArdC [Cetobacterium ceti]